jgi:hypothetical protein
MRLYVLVILIGVVSLACAFQSAQTDTRAISRETGGTKLLGVEEIASRASSLYNQSLEQGRSKEDAVRDVVRFLKSQGCVTDAEVMGSDSVRVYFKDGNDLLLLLGKNRL